MFNQNKELEKVRLEQSILGSFEFEALYPVLESKFPYSYLIIFIGTFTEEDFEYEECDEITSIILDEAKTFVTFMQTIVEELVGKEDYMMSFLNGKINSSYKGLADKGMDNDEEDDEE